VQERQPAGGITVRELGPDETSLAHAVMVELGRDVGDPAAFAEHVNAVLRPEGYRLVVALEPGEQARDDLGAAGF